MRVLVHDYSGHPFQVDLSRELARRGHAVTHSYCEAYVSGKGHLQPQPGESVTFDAIGRGVTLLKMRFRRRLAQEARFGFELVAQVRRQKPEVVLASNVPVPTLVILAIALRLMGIPWTLWHQDVQCLAIRSFAGAQLSYTFRLVAVAIEIGERWCSQQARSIVVIAESFVDIHRRWGTASKVTVIPNWAPLKEIVPRPRDNAWAKRQGLVGVKTLLYSGTLGLKHDPSLLVALAAQVAAAGQPVRLVVVNEGPAVEPLLTSAAELGVPLTLLPFQPYDDLPDVLGSGDVLLVLLEKTAGAFSVPSKTLSYLCAGRPILGLMPAENSAAQLLVSVGSCVLPPDRESLQSAAAWAVEVLRHPDRAETLGAASRALAECEFDLFRSAEKFERILRAGGTSVAVPVYKPRVPESRCDLDSRPKPLNLID